MPNRLFSWLGGGESLDSHLGRHRAHPWYLVIWLTGVDYFSTLGYQPGIALLAAGALSPLATAVLVAVTLACALPIYSQVAGRSFVGQGSIAMLENLLPGWWGRILVLVLLGFAATDFVITMTLSAADAAQHAIENPYMKPLLGHGRLGVTLVLLFLLAAVFMKGFAEAIELATAVCIPYLLLNVIVLVRAVFEAFQRPGLMEHWHGALLRRGDWTGIALASVLIFPKLALGLSGFETGVSVMPLIAGTASDDEHPDDPPHGRIRNTRKLLATAALIMSVMLIISSFVTTLLIPEHAYKEGGPASGRAIAYLAHELMGNLFGSIYDVSTILILWFAGASAMAGLLHLIPRYLPRVGLAPEWVAYARPLVLVLFGFDVLITLIFHASVDAQGGAYATGVLVLMSSAAVASAISLWKEGRMRLSFYCWAVSAVFAYTTVANVVERPDGIIIASFFILFIVAVSGVSRYWRSTEFRVSGMKLDTEESHRLWDLMISQKIYLVPIHGDDAAARQRVTAKISNHYKVDAPLAFVHVELLDNRSEFLAPLVVTIIQEGENYVVTICQAVAIANAIAYLSDVLHPLGIFIGLSRQNLMRQSFRYFLLGEGETGLMVYTILLKRWANRAADQYRTLLFLMSD